MASGARESIVHLLGVEEVVQGAVTENMTAMKARSGDVPVLATPMVLALVEGAAVRALEGKLPSGTTTVGVSVNLTHAAPTPVGETVEVRVRVDVVEERRVHFSFHVSDAQGAVAFGVHERAIIDRDRFLEFAERRRSGAAEPTDGPTG
ncbi:MAG: thioesterase [Actinomycetota bacterium]|nr:thioesterase [Actinomycetota bacterium]